MKNKKGHYKYLKKAPIRQGIITLVMVFMSAAVMYLGYYITGNFKNLITVIAVLGMLPAAKSLVSYIMYMKAEKFAASQELYNKVWDCVDNKDENLYNELIGFDAYLTSYKDNFPIKVFAVKNNSLIGLAPEKCDTNKAKDHILEYMGKNSISGITVKIFDNEDRFFDRFKEIANEPVNENEVSTFGLMLNLSL